MKEHNVEIEFICKNCNFEVVKSENFKGRNHCPKCLYSLHLDIFPNDNANSCHGLMQPVGTLQTEENELLIIHKCSTCDKSSRAKVVFDDNYEKILEILN